ncbi:MAG: hypothetical protein RJA22_1605 [Verrucomicrobiota bacterium]|jgi:dTDP-4-dehydrorhamnose reductase
MAGPSASLGPIVILGGTGYVGQAFRRELERRGLPAEVWSRREVDYTRWDTLLARLRARRPQFLIHCAGHTGRPNVDACEAQPAETLAGNTLLPLTVAHACLAAGLPWGHVSSGCLYNGAWLRQPDGSWRVERDLARPEVRARLEADPGGVRGFAEEDPPNFSFRQPPCSMYSGSKALGEEAIAGLGEPYVWRLRIPFDERDGPRNYLSKLQRYARLYDNVNSLSHLGDFAWACMELWRLRAPGGIYHVTNPGHVTTRQVAGQLHEALRLDRPFRFFADDAEFYGEGGHAPRSNCILDTAKLAAAGVRLRPVTEALADALRRWQPEAAPAPAPR